MSTIKMHKRFQMHNVKLEALSYPHVHKIGENVQVFLDSIRVILI
jgi:hypothetical protein